MSETMQIPPTDVRTEAFVELVQDAPSAYEVSSLDELPIMTVIIEDDGEPFTGRVIGFGSSYRGESHRNHKPGTPVPKGESCSKCRWTDTFIMRVSTEVEWNAEAGRYRETAPPEYVLISLGKSAIPGETQRNTVIWTSEPTEVLRKLFAPTKPKFKFDKGSKSIPPHNGTAIREAAQVEPAFAALVEQYGEAIPHPRERGAEADPLADL